MRQVFAPGDRVSGAFDSARVVEVDGRRVLIEWDPVDAAGVDRGPGRMCWREAWTLSRLPS